MEKEEKEATVNTISIENSVTDLEPVPPVATVAPVPVSGGFSGAQRKDLNMLDSLKNCWDRKFPLAKEQVTQGQTGEPTVAFCRDMMREIGNWMGKKDLMSISLTLIQFCNNSKASDGPSVSIFGRELLDLEAQFHEITD